MSLALTLVVLVIVTWALVRYRRMTLLKRMGFPGPRPHIIYGNMEEIAEGGGPSAMFDKWHAMYGPIVGYYVGGVPNLAVADEELLKKVLITDFKSFHRHQPYVKGAVNAVAPLTNPLIFTPDIEDWRRKRVTLSPAFTTAQLRQVTPLIIPVAEELVRALKEKADGDEFPIAKYISRTTLGMIARTAFGVDFGYAANASRSELSDNLVFVLDTITNVRLENLTCGTAMVLFPELTFALWPIRVFIDWIRGVLDWSPESKLLKTMLKMLHVRRKAAKNDHVNPRHDLMQMLIDARQRYDPTVKDSDLEAVVGDTTNSIEETVEIQRKSVLPATTALDDGAVMSSIFTVLSAGYEATKTTMQFMMYSMANNQEVQYALRKEVAKLEKNEDGKWTYEALMFGSPLLQAVVRETLRMYPPAPQFASRMATSDFNYQGRTIPNGTGILPSVLPLQLSEQHWPDPCKWDPYRHISADGKKNINPPSQMSYQPFGHGPRNCMGMRLAYIEVSLVAASLVQSFQLVPGPSTPTGRIDTDESTFFLLQPLKPIHIKLISVENLVK